MPLLAWILRDVNTLSHLLLGFVVFVSSCVPSKAILAIFHLLIDMGVLDVGIGKVIYTSYPV